MCASLPVARDNPGVHAGERQVHMQLGPVLTGLRVPEISGIGSLRLKKARWKMMKEREIAAGAREFMESSGLYH